MSKPGFFEVARLPWAVCSDPECPCAETELECGTGYLWISQEVVEFRRNTPRIADVEKRYAGRMLAFGPGVASPIAMCKDAAERRGVDLEVAAADFTHWWKTGQVPLRATPAADNLASLFVATTRISNPSAPSSVSPSMTVSASDTGNDAPTGLSVACPNCGNFALVPANAVGKKARCNECNTVFTLAMPASASIASPQNHLADDHAARSPEYPHAVSSDITDTHTTHNSHNPATRLPAKALLVTAVIYFAFGMLFCLRSDQQVRELVVVYILSPLFIAAGAMNMWYLPMTEGGLKMGIIGCIVAMIVPPWIPGLLVGIWGLLVLQRQRVRAPTQARTIEPSVAEDPMISNTTGENEVNVLRLAAQNGHLLRELLQLVGSDGGFGNKTRIREIGEELNRIGGMGLMQCAYYGVKNSGLYFSQDIWSGIGNWQS